MSEKDICPLYETGRIYSECESCDGKDSWCSGNPKNSDVRNSLVRRKLIRHGVSEDYLNRIALQ